VHWNTPAVPRYLLVLANGEPANPAVYFSHEPVRTVIGQRFTASDGSQWRIADIAPPPASVSNEFLAVWTVEPLDQPR
jgi:hypothetical protein